MGDVVELNAEMEGLAQTILTRDQSGLVLSLARLCPPGKSTKLGVSPAVESREELFV